MEHAVGLAHAHAYGQVPDGKEAAEEALDGTQVRCIAAAALSCPPGSATRLLITICPPAPRRAVWPARRLDAWAARARRVADGGQGCVLRAARQGVPEPTQLLVEGMLMKLLAQSPDGTLMCCANETHLKFVDSRFLKLYETNTPGAIMAASFHPQKYELFLKIDSRTLVAKSPAPAPCAR